MEKNRFLDIPAWWPVCTNEGCPMADDCLRLKAGRELPESADRWMAVMPGALKDGQCRYYQKSEVVRMARGLNTIYRNVHSRTAVHQIRMCLTRYLGSKGSYYRYKDGERWLNPDQQQSVIGIVRQFGGQVEVDFDEYQDTYDFTRLPK